MRPMIAPFENYDSRQCLEERYRQNVHSSRLLIRRASYLRGGFCFCSQRLGAGGIAFHQGPQLSHFGENRIQSDQRGLWMHDYLRRQRDRRARRTWASITSTLAAATSTGTTSGWWAQGLKASGRIFIFPAKTDGTTKQAALQELDTSLSELGTDHLDVWYLHEKNSPSALPDELFEAQQIARQQGKIRFAGVSTHNPKDMVPFLVKKGATDVVLATFNFTMEKDFADAMAQANAAGLGVVAMKVMAGGFRRNKPDDPTGAKLKREGAMLAALKWVLKDTYVHTTIPGITDMDQLEENLKAMTEPYSPREEQLLARQLDFITPLYCRMCGECDGHCAKGLPVADVLRYVMYADGYGQFELGRDHFKQLPVELAVGALRRLPNVHGGVPFWREGPATPQPRAGDVCVSLNSSDQREAQRRRVRSVRFRLKQLTS